MSPQPTSKRFVVLSGLPCGGKSALAGQLARVGQASACAGLQPRRTRADSKLASQIRCNGGDSGWAISNSTGRNAYQTTAHSSSAFVTKFNPDDGSGAVTLAYSTYLGGVTCCAISYGQGIAVDSTGAAYVGGTTLQLDFPTLNALPAANGGGASSTGAGFVAKLNAYSGSGAVSLAYSTYLGGTTDATGTANADSLVLLNGINGIAVDSQGAAYVTGLTRSSNFPLVRAYQTTTTGILTGPNESCGGGDAFIAKFNAYNGSGNVSLAYSSYFGGRDSDFGYAIAVDQLGAAYITGSTSTWCLNSTGDTNPSNFPILSAYKSTTEQGRVDAFVAKFDPVNGSDGLALAYSTYLGGSNDDYGYAIAVDSSGSAYVAGLTLSLDFPTVRACQTANNTCKSGICGTAFVTKLKPDGTDLVYSTYLGGSTLENSSQLTNEDIATGIAVDSSGAAYVEGYTLSSDFPVVNAYQSANAGSYDTFLARFDPNSGKKDLTLAYSTYLGGSSGDIGHAVAVGADGAVYVAGTQNSSDFPFVNAYTSHVASGFVTKFNPALLMITSAHTGNFSQGQQGATYTVTVANASNAWGPTAGTVTVTETVPSGLTLVSMSGTEWSCSGNSCTCSDVLPPGYSYQDITVKVNVAGTAASLQQNQVSVSGGASNPASATDPTAIDTSPAVTIQTSPAGLQFSVDSGAAQTAPQTLYLSPGTHTIAVATPQAGSAGTQYVFTGWSDDGTALHTISVGGTAATYTASFKTQYQLTTAANPTAAGSVSPASGSFFDSGSSVTVTATPTAPFAFSWWSGGASGTSNPGSVTMDAAKSVIGNFVTTAFSCDINGDAATDAVDVQIIIGEALGVLPAINDLSHHMAVNVLDVQKVVNAAVGRGCAQ